MSKVCLFLVLALMLSFDAVVGGDDHSNNYSNYNNHNNQVDKSKCMWNKCHAHSARYVSIEILI